MEEVKIWAVQEESNVSKLEKGGVDTEHELEDILVQNPDMLIAGLTLVGRQTPTENGSLDPLGVDEDGKLVVFELKRGTLTRDAVAQVIDYASDLDAMGIERLPQHIQERSGKDGIEKIDNFKEWYDTGNFGDLEGLLPPRMFLVGLGVDNRTERMVNFLAKNSNLDIALLTFHGFNYEGKTLLAKQVKVEGRDRPPDKRPSNEELSESLRERSKEFGIGFLYEEIRKMLSDNWPSSKQYPKKLGFTVTMQPSPGKRRRSYARIDPENEQVRLVFFQRAIDMCRDEFMDAVDLIPCETWPRHRHPIKDKGNTEIQFLLSQDAWNSHRETISKVTRAVYEGLEDSSTEDDVGLDPLITTSSTHA